MRAALRWVGRIALGLVAFIALVAAAAFGLLQTRAGSDLARRLALPRINATIAGDLRFDRLRLRPDRLVLEGVALRDPRGDLVARVERIDVAFKLLPLFHRRVDLPSVAIVRPELHVVQDAGGTNLLRAIAARRPASAKRPSVAPAAQTEGGDGAGVEIALGRLTITAAAIDFRSVIPGAERHARLSGVTVEASARHAGAGPLLASLDGWLQLTVPPGRLDDHVLGPARLTARAVHGHCELADLYARLPGVEITGHGTVTARDADVHLHVEADDLSALARSLAPRHGSPPIALGGRGRLDVALVGPLDAPALRVAGQFPRLAVDDKRAGGVTLSAVVPNLRRPDAADLELAAPLLSIGAQALRGIKISVHAATPRLTLQASTSAPFPLALAVTGRRESPRAVIIESATLRYPEATWALARPARITAGDEGRLTVEGFELRAGRQTIRADLTRTGDGTRGRLAIAALDLGRLPRALVPPRLGLGGVLDVAARLSGTTSDPRVSARVALAGGRVRGYRDLALDADAAYAGGRARGRLGARGLGTSVTATFDLPARWPARDGHAPVHLDFALARTDLDTLTKALAAASGRPAPARVQGRARVAVSVDGTARAPALNVDVRASGLAVDGQTIGDLSLSIDADGDHPSEARLAIARATDDGTAHTVLALKTPLSLRRLLRKPPTSDELARTPVQLTGDVESLPLAMLASLARYPSKVGGALSSHLAFSGTALAPKGSLTVDVSGATTGRFPPTDARVELQVDRDAIELRTRVTRTQRALLALVARLGAGPTALREPERLATAPLQLRAVIGPLGMERLGLPPESDRDPPRVLKGRLRADLTVDGTLRAPRAVMNADAADVRLDKALIGAGKVAVVYADRQARVDAELTSVNGGWMRARAATRADLGYPAVMRLDAGTLPLDVHVDAQRFDVGGLSGAAQSLRTVGGLLTAAATVRGTVANPRVGGNVEWTDGVLAVTGLGEYRAIHLAAHGDEDNLTLDDLSVQSGNGRAHASGKAAHVAGRGYQLTARADVKTFPIYKEGQPLAAATVAADLQGMLSPLFSKVTVDVHDARIELSDAKRKDLQPLESPGDVVLVDDGKPLNRAQAEKLRALAAARVQKGDRDGNASGKGDSGVAPVKAPAATTPARRGVRIAVNAPRRLWVTGKDAYLELGLAPGFRVSSGDETRVYGQVIVHRGRIDVFGRRFDLKADSTLEFDGPPDRPQLDVSAQYQNQSENVTVVWTAKGPVDHLTIAVSSPNRPDLTESQLYTLVITGHLQLGGGGSASGSSSASAQAASFLGGVLASRLQKTLAKALPLDVLTIDAGGGEGLTGTQLEAGRYVTDRLYLGYVGRVGADPTRYQNRNAVHVEYQLTSRWGFDGEYGDVGTASFDLLWKRNY